MNVRTTTNTHVYWGSTKARRPRSFIRISNPITFLYLPAFFNKQLILYNNSASYGCLVISITYFYYYNTIIIAFLSICLLLRLPPHSNVAQFFSRRVVNIVFFSFQFSWYDVRGAYIIFTYTYISFILSQIKIIRENL